MDERPDELTCYIIDKALTISISQAYHGNIDFNDQVYMAALFAGQTFYPRQYPIVLIDEYQDLSPVNHAIVEKLCKSARQIGVGDEAQAIYGFRGAESDGMAAAVKKFSMTELPLSTSFRCPSAIVENVHWRVPEFTYFRQGGLVCPTADPLEISDNSAVICRNNAPLLALAMKLLAKGRKINVSGTDVSNRLIKYLTKLGDESMPKRRCLAAVDEWLAVREENESKSARDMADCMRVFIGYGDNLGQAIAYVRHVFSQHGTIEFMSGHKSKGLEFTHVYHLDQSLIRQTDQDKNLRYVIDTRSKDNLTYIESPHDAKL